MISVCPCHEDSLELVLQLVNQTIEIIGRDNIKFLHIGADEVFNLASCPKCKLFVEETSHHQLFARFVTKVVKKLNKKYNVGNSKTPIQFMIWDDMLRGWDLKKLDVLKIKDKHMVEPCIWSYSGDTNVFQQTVAINQIGNTLVSFDHLWFSSAWRGCFTPDSTFVDHELRLKNQFSWIDFYRKCPFKDKVRGIILTGWSRYTHETVLCELFCMSVPSLVLSLNVIDTQQLRFEVILQDLMKTLFIDPSCLYANRVGQVFDFSNLEAFELNHPFIDCLRKQARKQIFCNDAFEIGWIVVKGDYSFRIAKQLISNWSMINHIQVKNKTTEENSNAF